MSIAGGMGQALLRGEQAGCDCVQVFTKSSRQWAARAFSKDEVADFKRNRIATGISTVVAHDSYLLNLCAPDLRIRQKSLAGFIDEIERCELLGIPFLVTHPG